MNMKRGFTLVELMISLGLFTVLSTVVIISFITFANIQARTNAMKNSQQKMRTALDQMIKQVKEAKSVVISEEDNRPAFSDPNYPNGTPDGVNDSKYLTLYFSEPADIRYAAQYKILLGENALYYKECNVTGVITGQYRPCVGTNGIHSEISEDILSVSNSGSNTSVSVALDYANSGYCWNSPRNTTATSFSCPGAPDDSSNMEGSIKARLKGSISFSSNRFYQDEFDIETIVSVGSGLIASPSDYTVSYLGNSNDGGAVPAGGTYNQGASVTVASNTGGLTRTGYTFSGWNTQADGNGTDRAAGSTFNMPGSNQTLFAKWTPVVAYVTGCETTVTIGTQTWCKRNYNGGTFVNWAWSPPQSIGTKWCYGDDVNNCDTYGGLYQWNVGMSGSSIEGAQGVCPAGFHFPSNDDFKILETYLGISAAEIDQLITPRGTDQGNRLLSGGSSGFDLLKAGGTESGGFGYINDYAILWTSTIASNPNARLYRMVTSASGGIVNTANIPTNAKPIRCLKD